MSKKTGKGITVILDESQYEKLTQLASDWGVSRAAMIRMLILQTDSTSMQKPIGLKSKESSDVINEQ